MHDTDFLQDLAIVMIVAGLVTVIFHRLKQPVVLGYILAGVIVGPHTPPFPLIHDEQTIKTLSKLGIIFLMFSLGLEFSLRKLKAVGVTAFIAATLEILVMLWAGFALGQAFGPVQLGVSFRPSYLHYESGSFSDSRNPLMNADIEGAYRGHGWTAYGEAGRMPAIGTEDAKLYSREHWVSYEGKHGIGIKAGRYMPAYGVYFSDHTSLNRNDLGFDKYDQVYGLEVSHTSERSLLQVSLSPGRAESIVNDDGGSAFNTTGRLQVDFGPKVVVVGSGLYRDASSLEARHGATGGALGLAPWRRLAIWTEGDAYIRGSDGGTSFVFANETAYEAFRGIWLRVSPQSRSSTDQFPGVFRWNVGADLLPRTHVHVNLDFYHDKTDGSVDAVKTFLAQLHLYL